MQFIFYLEVLLAELPVKFPACAPEISRSLTNSVRLEPLAALFEDAEGLLSAWSFIEVSVVPWVVLALTPGGVYSLPSALSGSWVRQVLYDPHCWHFRPSTWNSTRLSYTKIFSISFFNVYSTCIFFKISTHLQYMSIKII